MAKKPERWEEWSKERQAGYLRGLANGRIEENERVIKIAKRMAKLSGVFYGRVKHELDFKEFVKEVQLVPKLTKRKGK